jgi:uncharacterized phage protein (TIGR02216 family)
VTPFPWDDVMAFGLGALRLSPDAFWSLTPRELAAVAGPRGGTALATAADLTRLMASFPDAPG